MPRKKKRKAPAKTNWLKQAPAKAKSLAPQKIVGHQLIKYLGLLFWLAQIGLLVLSWSSLPPEIPLFFSRPWGEAQLAHRSFLLLLPATTIAIYIFNFILANIIKEKRLIAEILTTTATVFALLSLISLTQIIRLVS